MHVILTFLILLMTSEARAERLPIKAYTTADGLANNIVNQIVRDSRGFLWFCTREGLSRFDGHGFLSYGIDHGLPSGVVNDLIETRDGEYWIATGNGLVRFDPLGVTGRQGETPGRPAFITYPLGQDRRANYVTALLEGKDGTLWAATQRGLFAVAANRSRSVATPRQSGDWTLELNALAEDASGALWIAASDGLYRFRGGEPPVKLGTHDGLPGDFVATVLVDRAGRVWVGTTTGGIALVGQHPKTDLPIVRRVYTTSDGLGSNWVTEIAETTDGTLWAATAGGFSRFVPGAGDDMKFRSYGAAEGLPFPTTNAIGEDRHGNVWVGTSIGAAKVLADGFTIFGDRDGISTAASLLSTASGDLFVMDGGGEWRVSRYDGRKFVHTRIPYERLQASWGWNQMFLVDGGGDWWIGTRTGVWRFARPTSVDALTSARPVAQYTHRDGLAADVVLRLLEDSRGDLWVSTVGEGRSKNGLSRWERRTGAWSHFVESDGLPPLDQYYVSALVEDRAGNVWVGMSGDGGLGRYQSGRFTMFNAGQGVPGGAIRNLTVDAQGRLWAASYRGGLIRTDRPSAATPAFSVYNTSRGLSSNETSAIVEDDQGRIYVGTARGLDRLDPLTDRIVSYRAGEGPLLGEMQAALKQPSGALWFSYNSGVVRLVPTPESPRAAPQVLITAVRVAGERLPVSAVGETDVADARLTRDDHSLEIDFVAPGFGPREGVTYQFMLEGADRTWGSPTEQRTVSYANLAPGGYRFIVRAINREGKASESVAGFGFTVPSPLWQRWWFLTIVTALLAGVAQAVHRYRVARVIALAQVRTHIASDLHDDIGANLTKIAVLTEVVRRQVGSHPPADAHLDAIATVARESVTAMGDIVWAVSPDRDTLQELGRKIREHAEETFADREVAVTFDLPEATRDVKLSGDVRRDVYLIGKEAITNAARHAGCSRLSIELSADGRQLRLGISDDGVGFDPSLQGDGDGLPNLRRRAMRLGGTLEISSQSGSGTSIRLHASLTGRRASVPA
jgi:ligand-binding sensor domain-containing protein/signal transduction histidine kinase